MKLRTTLLAATAMMLAAAAHAEDLTIATVNNGDMIRMQGLMDDFNALNVITVIAALTAGSAFLMWIGERITENGVGNGISIVLTINIISSMPSDLSSLYQQFVKGKAVAVGALAAVIIKCLVFFRLYCTAKQI
mgnify:CR=1 FL=1